MQIEKIDNNKLEIVLSVDDLKNNNIDVHSFLSNSDETQKLFFNILDLAEKEFDFIVDEDKFVVESMSLNENLFLITITKLSTSLTSADNSKSFLAFKLDSENDFFYILEKIQKQKLHSNLKIYRYSNSYFFILKKSSNFYIKNILEEFCVSMDSSSNLENVLEEYGSKLKIKT